MQSTMMNAPLDTAAILRHGSRVHPTARVRTMQPDGSVKVGTFADVARRSAQLAHALRDCGVTGDERVATLMWNNQEHVEAYCAVPSMGAVLHTLNIRLSPEQLGYIANHARDEGVIVDMTLAPLLARALPDMPSVPTVIAVGHGDTDTWRATGTPVPPYHALRTTHLPPFECP